MITFGTPSYLRIALCRLRAHTHSRFRTILDEKSPYTTRNISINKSSTRSHTVKRNLKYIYILDLGTVSCGLTAKREYEQRRGNEYANAVRFFFLFLCFHSHHHIYSQIRVWKIFKISNVWAVQVKVFSGKKERRKR